MPEYVNQAIAPGAIWFNGGYLKDNHYYHQDKDGYLSDIILYLKCLQHYPGDIRLYMAFGVSLSWDDVLFPAFI